MTTGQDHRTAPRRRGETLRKAIFAATLAELTEVGYGGLTMERIADRARTSKASLYRRWPTRAELVVDAFVDARPAPEPPPDTGNVRDDLVGLLRGAADRLAGPAGQITRGIIGDAMRHPELLALLRDRGLGSRHDAVREVLDRAVARGEIEGGAAALVVGLGPALLSHHFLMYGPPVSDAVVTGIVDDVVVPLLRREGRR